ncbi:TA system VapC family ribonuclease toxin [Luteimonas sp. FCS-9]|uniref:TA system VapC family ribonuclease toxin n=1 Tax=Luteimonas sp. FCS-9 TaxID=1547516 RepID=UPI000AAA567B|nr:TA system VapC family ribonuclease toxin [Luteimonas sp. FCS-9]
MTAARHRVAERAPGWPPGAPVHLLDVNVLLALIDPLHAHHDRAHDWFAEEGAQGWASCPITQNGALRIMANPRYPNPAGSVAEAAQVLAGLCAHPAHRFWPDALSLLDASHVAHDRLLSSGQVTDTYLLALAVRMGGRLASFDRRLVVDAVRGGAEALRLLP